MYAVFNKMYKLRGEKFVKGQQPFALKICMLKTKVDESIQERWTAWLQALFQIFVY